MSQHLLDDAEDVDERTIRRWRVGVDVENGVVV